MKNSITYRGREITIEQDDSPESPREWDNGGTLVCWHRRYDLGDKHDHSPEGFREWWAENGKGGICLPVYLYDHSGLRIKVGSFQGLLPQGHAEWDSGQVGWIYATRETILKEWGTSKRVSPKARKLAENCLRSEIEAYDQYLSGDVYGYTAGDDSCWGFYGYDYCLQEAKGIVDYQIKKSLKLKLNRLKEFIRNHVSLAIRWDEFKPEEQEA